jgi:hypothetical protein
VAALLAFTVLRVVRWYGMATCLRTGWGTREEIEVPSGPAPVQLAPAESLHEVLDLKALGAAHKAVVSGTGPRHTPAAVAARLSGWGPASEDETVGRHRA